MVQMENEYFYGSMHKKLSFKSQVISLVVGFTGISVGDLCSFSTSYEQ